MPEGGALNLNLHFQPRQWEAFTSHATELLYGGAAFGAKSHFLRAASILWCLEIPGLQVYLFRRVEDELIKNHMDGPHGYRNMLSSLSYAKKVTINELQIRFFNGSQINLCHCKDEKHRFRYHGDEMHVLLIDELTTFTELIYRYLRFRVRMVGIQLPDRWKQGGYSYDPVLGPDGRPRISATPNPYNLFPRIVAASNPGNIGHHWCKRTWGLDGPGLTTPVQMPDLEGGMVRQYIHARYVDNPIGMHDDPAYLARMDGLGDPGLVKAMKEGDWNLVAGGFFPEFSLERHVLKARSLPADKFSRLFRSEDWGSARPFSVGWYGICDEPWVTEGTLGNLITVPRGAIVRYREWYGKLENEDNRGLKLPADRWGRGILMRTPEAEATRMRYDVCDPSIFKEDGGPSIAEMAGKVRIGGRALIFRPGDNRREPGWTQMRGRFRGDEGVDEPYLFLMDNQPDAIRLIQSVQHDESYPEDLNTDAEDHAVDEIRYGCASRPRAVLQSPPRKRTGPLAGTYDWLIQQGGRGGISAYNIDAEAE